MSATLGSVGLTRAERNQLHAQTDEQRSATLQRLLANAIEGRAVNATTMKRAQAVVDKYTDFLQRHGIAFPELVFVCVASRGHVELVRKDLDHAGIQMVARNIVERFANAGITWMEILPALQNAFPDYRGNADYVPRGGAAILEANGAVNG